jgi:hypothetical protein
MRAIIFFTSVPSSFLFFSADTGCDLFNGICIIPASGIARGMMILIPLMIGTATLADMLLKFLVIR